MEAVGIVLNIDANQVADFEQGFRNHELHIWEDFVGRGIMLHASLTKMDISTQPIEGAVQYLISVTFAGSEGHHLHDSDPRFQTWNEMADAFQIASPFVSGGEVIISAGEPTPTET